MSTKQAISEFFDKTPRLEVLARELGRVRGAPQTVDDVLAILKDAVEKEPGDLSHLQRHIVTAEMPQNRLELCDEIIRAFSERAEFAALKAFKRLREERAWALENTTNYY